MEDTKNPTKTVHPNINRLFLIGPSSGPTPTNMDLLFYIHLMSQIDISKEKKERIV
jgi:hypothetical protein